jgi:type IV secretory pathway TrbL component
MGLGYVLLPLGLFKQTRFVTEKLIATCFAYAVKVLALTVVMMLYIHNVKYMLIDQNALKSKDLSVYFGLLFSSGFFAFMSIKAPQLANALVNGQPAFGNDGIKTAGQMMSGAIKGLTGMVGAGAAAGGSAAGAVQTTEGNFAQKSQAATRAVMASLGGSASKTVLSGLSNAYHKGTGTDHGKGHGGDTRRYNGNPYTRKPDVSNSSGLLNYGISRAKEGYASQSGNTQELSTDSAKSAYDSQYHRDHMNANHPGPAKNVPEAPPEKQIALAGKSELYSPPPPPRTSEETFSEKGISDELNHSFTNCANANEIKKWG